MASSASPNRGNGNVLIFHRLTSLDERVGRVEERVARVEERMGRVEESVEKLDRRVGGLEETVGGLKVSVGKLDTKMNIVLGILGAIGSGATFLLIRMLAS